MLSHDKPTEAKAIIGRRQVLTGMAAGALFLSGLHASSGQAGPIHPVLRTASPILIAIPNFVGVTPADSNSGAYIAQAITNDLSRSHALTLINQSVFRERITDVDKPPQFANWKQIADELVVGRVTRQSDGRSKVEFRLWDVASGQQLVGQQYIGSPDDWRSVAHMISNDVYGCLTGEKGDF
jgi:TolB protein